MYTYTYIYIYIYTSNSCAEDAPSGEAGSLARLAPDNRMKKPAASR